jgi:hypothetical protein
MSLKLLTLDGQAVEVASAGLRGISARPAAELLSGGAPNL